MYFVSILNCRGSIGAPKSLIQKLIKKLFGTLENLHIRHYPLLGSSPIIGAIWWDFMLTRGVGGRGHLIVENASISYKKPFRGNLYFHRSAILFMFIENHIYRKIYYIFFELFNKYIAVLWRYNLYTYINCEF